MIANYAQLNAVLHQLGRIVDMLQALETDCRDKNDFTLFPLVSEGYLTRIRQLNQEIKCYLAEQSDKELAAAS